MLDNKRATCNTKDMCVRPYRITLCVCTLLKFDKDMKVAHHGDYFILLDQLHVLSIDTKDT